MNKKKCNMCGKIIEQQETRCFGCRERAADIGEETWLENELKEEAAAELLKEEARKKRDREYGKKYYAEHKEEKHQYYLDTIEKRKRQYQERREEIKKRNATEEGKARQRAYYLKNYDKIRENQRIYRLTKKKEKKNE